MSAQDKILNLLQGILDKGVDEFGPLSSARKLAYEYRGNDSYKTDHDRIDAIIRWEAAKNFATGFASGLGGLLTAPIAIPSSLTTTWLVGSRMSGAIATLNGHSVQDDRVRTFILISLLGKKFGAYVLKQAGVSVGNQVAMNLVQSVSGSVLRDINRAVGFRLVTKAGQAGVINLARAVPIAGGLVAGGIDAAASIAVGKTAKNLFSKSGANLQDGSDT